MSNAANSTYTKMNYSTVSPVANTDAIAVGDRKFLGIQDFDFVHI